MGKRGLFIVIIVVLAISIFAWVQFVGTPNKGRISESNMQGNPETHDFGKVLAYENKYMGNASNVSALFQALPLNDAKGTLEMNSEKFLLIVNYSSTEHKSERMVMQSVIYNTTAALVLINNLQQTEMRFPNESFIIHRGNVEKWFDTDLTELKDPVEFKNNVQEPLKKKDLIEWMGAYTERVE